MTRKELNKMKREFKSDSTMVNIKEVYNIYIKKDNNSIIYSNINYFDRIDEELKELFLGNFKKILGGTLDTKLFQLQFKRHEETNQSQLDFDNLLNSPSSNEFKSYAEKLAGSIMEKCSFDYDAVVTIARGEYFLSSLKGKRYSEEEITQETIQSFKFIMGSINKVEPIKKTLMFNYENQEFVPTSSVDTHININNPLEGFMFPCLENKYSDVNKIMYYSSKPKELNYKLVEEVLGCTMKLTAEEEKSCFTDLIKNAVGDSVAPEVLESVYAGVSEIKEMLEEDEEENISLTEIKNILKGVNAKDIEIFEKVYEENLGKDYSFNINNILPDFKSKSLKIWNEDINISINPKNLNCVKQVKNEQGVKTLVIELKEDIIVDGFTLKAEE